MIPPISGLSGVSGLSGISGISAPDVAQAPASAGGADGGFGTALTNGIDALQQTQSTADGLATSASTGSLADVTSYMIASNEASLATSLTTAVRDKAVAAFTDIMNMQM